MPIGERFHSVTDMPAHEHGQLEVDTELEGELLLAFVTETAAWIADLRGIAAPPVRRAIDIGSGPGVGTCELARMFPDAHVIAVDSSPAMLERAAQRAIAHGLDGRVSTHVAELPRGLDGLARADVIWASMSLHHIGDEVASLRLLGALLERHGLLAVAELAEPMRVLPDDLDVGRPGLAERLDAAGASWFALDAGRAGGLRAVGRAARDAGGGRVGGRRVAARPAVLRPALGRRRPPRGARPSAPSP